jgi:predicted  nucleic acid-binding Zn-ribbon protein
MSKKKQIEDLKFRCLTLETHIAKTERQLYETNARLNELRRDFTRLTEAHNNSQIEINKRLKNLEKECPPKDPEINELSTRLLSI